MLRGMLSRRRFMKSIAAAFTGPVILEGCQSSPARATTLLEDPNKIIDLQEGFSYTVVSRVGDKMNDGLAVPGAHDGMAAFAGLDGRIILVTNHELSAGSDDAGPYENSARHLPETTKSRFYDVGGGISPGLGGTTTTAYNPATRRTESQFLSLGGTDINCAGGATPWGSWLSCEESFGQPGDGWSNRDKPVFRDQPHGYVFEVPAAATELVPAVPLKDMGRFEHEAAAVHAATSIVYLTEDQWNSLFYRFLPNAPGRLHKGGRLQALAIVDKPALKTHNWDARDVAVDDAMSAQWIDLDGVDSDENDLRKRGAASGAALFARGEGMTLADGRLIFVCTIGGPDRLGQIFEYSPSPYEGSDRESEYPGQLKLIVEANPNSLAKNCDNLTMAPWGDLIACEDTEESTDHCAMVGIRPDGSQYMLANNAYSMSEFAGACFSPDGRTLFVNIQYPGMTVAITGPWSG
jgi:secreted PhoX family phosphatase